MWLWLNIAPKSANALGIDYETLKAINPGLIYCAITAYGQDGPYADYPAHDANIIAAAGILGITGTPDGQYVLPGVPLADLCGGGMNAAVGILIGPAGPHKNRPRAVYRYLHDGRRRGHDAGPARYALRDYRPVLRSSVKDRPMFTEPRTISIFALPVGNPGSGKDFAGPWVSKN